MASADKISRAPNDDGNCRCRSSGHFGCAASHDNHIGFESDQIRCKLWQPVPLALGVSVFETNRFSFYIAELAKSLTKGLVSARKERRCIIAQHANDRNFALLLRVRGNTKCKQPSARAKKSVAHDAACKDLAHVV